MKQKYHSILNIDEITLKITLNKLKKDKTYNLYFFICWCIILNHNGGNKDNKIMPG
jgi:hypothetical protein